MVNCLRQGIILTNIVKYEFIQCCFFLKEVVPPFI